MGFTTQVLLGVTGSGKTFTMANVIERVQRPDAGARAQQDAGGAALLASSRSFFPTTRWNTSSPTTITTSRRRISPHTDTYIEKDSSINDEIDRLRHSATAALAERRDVIIVAVVSCIYGHGRPDRLREHGRSPCATGMQKDRDEVIAQLVEIQYERNDIDFARGTFRVRGDVVEIFPAGAADKAIRHGVLRRRDRPHQRDRHRHRRGAGNLDARCDLSPRRTTSSPASRWTGRSTRSSRICDERVKLVPQRRTSSWRRSACEQRTQLRHRDAARNRLLHRHRELFALSSTAGSRGSAPFTLLDYFPKDFLLFVDESHVTLPAGARACTTGIAPARRAWWNTASACPPPLTTAR